MKKRKLIQKEKRAKRKARKRLLLKSSLFSLSMLMICGLVMYIYQHHILASGAAGTLTQFKLWMAERKNNLHQELKKVKVASTRGALPEVHYEFYTALPNMHMIVPTVARAPAAGADSKNKLAAKPPIVSPREIEEALSQQIKTNKGG